MRRLKVSFLVGYLSHPCHCILHDTLANGHRPQLAQQSLASVAACNNMARAHRPCGHVDCHAAYFAAVTTAYGCRCCGSKSSQPPEDALTDRDSLQPLAVETAFPALRLPRQPQAMQVARLPRCGVGLGTSQPQLVWVLWVAIKTREWTVKEGGARS